MKFYELPESLDTDIDQYKNLVDDYLKGKIDKERIKAFRVPMGIYEQRDNEKYMMRIRLPGGAVTPTQLISISEIAEKYTDWPLHFTTRQDVQIHNLELDSTVNIYKQLKKIGLTSRGGGGNTVRNILGSYDSGIDGDEVFDISPYVQALTTRLIAESDSWTLPRKLKIAFSGSENDTGLATINDLGFIAKIKNNQKGFSVYIAGGMGRRSRVGFKLYDFIPDTEVYNIVKAVKNLFDKYGNRKNKYAARLRFLREQLGEKVFIAKFENELNEVRLKRIPHLDITDSNHINKGYLELPLFLGDISFNNAKKLGAILKEYGENTIRITPEQNILIRNIAEREINTLKEKLINEELIENLPLFIGNAVACAGASTCKLGICLSRNLLKAISQELGKTDLYYKKLEDISLKISGCSNSCGHHHIADIGFFGASKRYNNKPVPVYNLVIGGIIHEEKTRLAEKACLLPAKSVPLFLKDFIKHIIEHRQDEEKFSEYIERIGKSWILDSSEKYSAVPPYEKDRSYYYDWFDEKEFSLADIGEGECSAGLFDLIDYNLNEAEKSLNEAKTETSSEKLQESLNKAVVYLSHSLLITKGLEPKNDYEAVLLFKDHFIGKHISSEYNCIINKFLIKDKIQTEEVFNLYNEVKNLYNKMDNSLRFPEYMEPERNQEKNIQKDEIKDFRGIPCPLNLAKTKIALEQVNKGQILGILLDDGAPIDNVPPSLIAEGHKILEKNAIENYWKVVIEKG